MQQATRTTRAGAGRARTASGWRGLAAALPLALLLAGCAEYYEDITGEPDVLGPDAKVSTGTDPDAETYPELGDVPDQPARRPSGQDSRRQLHEKLVADRANARYSDQELQGRDVEAADMPEEPAPADVSGSGAGAQDETGDTGGQDAAATSSTQDAGQRTGRELADGESLSLRDGVAADANTSQTSGQETQSNSSGSGDSAAQTDSRDLTARQTAARDGSGGGQARSDLPDDIPQIQESRRGEPIELPETPAFARDDTRSQGNGSAGGRRTSAAQSSQRAQATTGEAGMATPPSTASEAGARSRTFAAGDPGQTAGQEPGRRVAVIYFGHGSVGLDARDREVLRQVARLARDRGAAVRVIGHSSSRTAAMGLIEHRMANFDTSLARAETVADALVSMGVPRERIKVGGRSDRDPVYHEYMATGEAGNRRAEVFLGG